MKRARVHWVLGLGVTAMLLGGQAFAQTAPPPAPPPSPVFPCSPPCAPTETCFQGQCMVPAPPADSTALPPPVAAPEPSEPAMAPTPLPEAQTTGTEETPPPRRKQRPRPHKPVAEEDDDTPAAWRRGALVMPFAGFHAVEGISADDYDAGPRFGVLVGAHATPTVSLNVELAMDFLGPKLGTAVNRGTDISGHDLTIAFSPLFHARAGIGEFVVGPKLGFWSSSIERSLGSNTDQFSQTGWAFGFNMGAFAGIADAAALGAVLAYQMTYLNQSCARGPGVGMEGCESTGFAPQVLSFSLAAMF